jgi:hypothetical protein
VRLEGSGVGVRRKGFLDVLKDETHFIHLASFLERLSYEGEDAFMILRVNVFKASYFTDDLIKHFIGGLWRLGRGKVIRLYPSHGASSSCKMSSLSL